MNTAEGMFGQGILLAVFAAALGCAVAADIRFKRVKRKIWWWAGGAAAALFLWRGTGQGWEAGKIAAQIAVFVLLQFCLFAKMYGKADCFAFSCCSILLGAFGGGMKDYLLHMLFSTAFLGIVQMMRGNVNRRGNLREPKAFIPYIAAAFLPILTAVVFRSSGCFPAAFWGTG